MKNLWEQQDTINTSQYKWWTHKRGIIYSFIGKIGNTTEQSRILAWNNIYLDFLTVITIAMIIEAIPFWFVPFKILFIRIGSSSNANYFGGVICMIRKPHDWWREESHICNRKIKWCLLYNIKKNKNNRTKRIRCVLASNPLKSYRNDIAATTITWTNKI